jgi:hypothetical protein
MKNCMAQGSKMSQRMAQEMQEVKWIAKQLDARYEHQN